MLLVYLQIFAPIRRQDSGKLDFLKEYILKYGTEEYGIEQGRVDQDIYIADRPEVYYMTYSKHQRIQRKLRIIT